MSWQCERQQLADARLQRLVFIEQGAPLTFARLIGLLSDNPDFCRFFSRSLADTPFTAFFWETPPVNRSSIGRPFECVLIDAPSLYAAAVQGQAFAEHFAACEQVSAVSFNNLGHDALLVAPCPVDPVDACAHLALFLRRAPQAAQQAFWRQVAVSLGQRLDDRPLWLSTCGTGVYWLHARLDSWPKYYSYTPYTSWSG